MAGTQTDGSRAAMKRATCSHCCEPFEPGTFHDYMLTDKAWAAVHPEGPRGFLHDECLQRRARSAGMELTAEDFTECLCFVNRHIHLPTPDDVLRKLTQRLSNDRAMANKRGLPVGHYGLSTTFFLTLFARQDLHAWELEKETARVSAMCHLFRSDRQVLGPRRTNLPVQPPVS